MPLAISATAYINLGKHKLCYVIVHYDGRSPWDELRLWLLGPVLSWRLDERFQNVHGLIVCTCLALDSNRGARPLLG